MYELIPVGDRSFYIDCPAKIGIYKIDDKNVCLIDSGNDKDSAKKVIRILDANGWCLKMIINTHSHADHIGGNSYLQEKTGCLIFCPPIEEVFCNHPILEGCFVYGGSPCKEHKNKFLLATPSVVSPLTPDVLPHGLEMLMLNGHSFGMAAIKTSDDVWFLGDCLTGEAIISKYHISFLYDVEEYINSLNIVRTLNGKMFVPSHAPACENISKLANINLAKTFEIISLIKKIAHEKIIFEDILTAVFNEYCLRLDINQYVLVGSTIRSYLSYLHNKEEMDIIIEDNKLYWRSSFNTLV